MNFDFATGFLKTERCVKREQWKDTFLFMTLVGFVTVPTLTNIPETALLPESVKLNLFKSGQSVCIEKQLLIVNAECQAKAWFPSVEDLLAQDWQVME